MPNYKQEILEFVGNEEIEGISIGEMDKDNLLSWEEAAPILDYGYDGGYGLHDCHPVYIWTKTQVIFTVVYDGATWLQSVPRHPISSCPDFAGSE